VLKGMISAIGAYKVRQDYLKRIGNKRRSSRTWMYVGGLGVLAAIPGGQAINTVTSAPALETTQAVMSETTPKTLVNGPTVESLIAAADQEIVPEIAKPTPATWMDNSISAAPTAALATTISADFINASHKAAEEVAEKMATPETEIPACRAILLHPDNIKAAAVDYCRELLSVKTPTAVAEFNQTQKASAEPLDLGLPPVEVNFAPTLSLHAGYNLDY